MCAADVPARREYARRTGSVAPSGHWHWYWLGPPARTHTVTVDTVGRLIQRTHRVKHAWRAHASITTGPVSPPAPSNVDITLQIHLSILTERSPTASSLALPVPGAEPAPAR